MNEQKPKKEKNRRITFYLPPKLAKIWDRLLELPDYVSSADLLRVMIRDFAKKKKVM